MPSGIYDAAVFGKREEVERIVAAHPEAVNESDEHGFTPLHGLAGEEYLAIAQYLVDHGADVNARNDEGLTPLHLATSPLMAHFLVANGADLEARSRAGETPLIVQAAEAGAEDVMAVLLKAGADANATGRDRVTALDIALAGYEDAKVQLLYRYGGTTARRASLAKPGRISLNAAFSGAVAPDPELDHPAGGAIAKLLYIGLQRAGWSVREIENWRDVGWSLDCSKGEARLECTLAGFGNAWMLQVAVAGSGWLARLFGRTPTPRPDDVWALAKDVHGLLASVFQELRWRWDGPPNANCPAEPPKPG
jgi:hypothetical protein